MPIHRLFRVAGLCGLAGLALTPGPVAAWPEDRGTDTYRVRPAPRVRLEQGLPRAAIVSGYLPRNNNVPMYNEPPGLRSRGGPAW